MDIEPDVMLNEERYNALKVLLNNIERSRVSLLFDISERQTVFGPREHLTFKTRKAARNNFRKVVIDVYGLKNSCSIEMSKRDFLDLGYDSFMAKIEAMLKV